MRLYEDCARHRHSRRYRGRRNIPDQVQLAWQFVGDTADRTAAVSLSTVPKDAKDGELFFVLSSAGTWSVEYAPQLQRDKLQQHE